MYPQASDPLRAVLAEGAARASRALGSGAPTPWNVTVGRAAACFLADYPERGVCSPADVVAAVVLGLRGPRCGSVLVALEPSDALRLVHSPGRAGPWQAGDAQATVDAYVAAAGGVAAALGDALFEAPEYGRPTLVEASLPGAVVSTHAPRDTLVVSAELCFRAAADALRAYACLLLEAKLLCGIAPTGAGGSDDDLRLAP